MYMGALSQCPTGTFPALREMRHPPRSPWVYSALREIISVFSLDASSEPSEPVKKHSSTGLVVNILSHPPSTGAPELPREELASAADTPHLGAHMNG